MTRTPPGITEVLDCITLARRSPTGEIAATAAASDRLADYLGLQFPAADRLVTGRGLVVATATLRAFSVDGLTAEVVLNLLAFAGERLITGGER